MSQRDIYVLCLCIVVLVLFVALFSYLVASLVTTKLKIIKAGLDDQRIITEYQQNKKKNPHTEGLYKVLSVIMACIFCALFAFAIYVNVTEGGYANGIPSIKVVKSGSMSYKNSKNTYLETHNLNDQFEMFDLIITRKLPDEFELELYDVVVYKHENGEMVIHRIVGIEEPNEKHPDKHHFKLQGDAVQFADTYPVLYEQMRGIYRGERVPFAGSFVVFLQSPAGYLCILLVIIGIILIPIVEKIFEKAENARLQIALGNAVSNEQEVYNAQVSGFLLDLIKEQMQKDTKGGKPVAKLVVGEKSYSIYAEHKEVCDDHLKNLENNSPLQMVVKSKNKNLDNNNQTK